MQTIFPIEEDARGSDPDPYFDQTTQDNLLSLFHTRSYHTGSGSHLRTRTCPSSLLLNIHRYSSVQRSSHSDTLNRHSYRSYVLIHISTE